MPEPLRPDICVIGAGSAGLSVAAAAAAFGVSVVLVERGKMGGDCLNYGCVPSKSLIAAASHAQAIRDAEAFGISASAPVVDFLRVRDHIRSTIATIAPHDSVERFTGLGVEVIAAEGRFVDPDTLEAGGRQIKARRFVIATGSRPAIPAIDGLQAVPYLTNETLFDLEECPAHLLVLGGGAIGLEMAQAFRRLGSKVTVLQSSRILSRSDPELVAVVKSRLKHEGVELIEQFKAQSVQRIDDGISITGAVPGGAQTVSGSHLLIATGRSANVEGLGLADAGVAFTDRGITTGPDLRSSNRRIYAIGDAAGREQFTHVASYHASLVVQQILFRLPAKTRTGIIPHAMFTDPELAEIGLTEAQARERHGKIEVLRAEFSGNDRAQAEKRTEGLVKIIIDRRSRILGVGIVGKDAGEMISQWSMAIANGFTLKQVRSFIIPYPTLSEAGRRAVVSHYAPMTKNRLVRAVVRFLSRFG